jgi:hypothetical protein
MVILAPLGSESMVYGQLLLLTIEAHPEKMMTQDKANIVLVMRFITVWGFR